MRLAKNCEAQVSRVPFMHCCKLLLRLFQHDSLISTQMDIQFTLSTQVYLASTRPTELIRGAIEKPTAADRADRHAALEHVPVYLRVLASPRRSLFVFFDNNWRKTCYQQAITRQISQSVYWYSWRRIILWGHDKWQWWNSNVSTLRNKELSTRTFDLHEEKYGRRELRTIDSYKYLEGTLNLRTRTYTWPARAKVLKRHPRHHQSERTATKSRRSMLGAII